METYFAALENSHDAVARQRVRADVEHLIHDAEDLVKATAGDLSGKAKEARMRVAATLERAKAACVHLQEQTAATAQAAARKADVVLREHPYDESLGVAFGLGLLIGVLVTRK